MTGNLHAYRRVDRIRRRADYDRVYQSRCYAADQTLVVQACANGLPRTRLGLSISRRVGHAVLRNRWKRLVREVFRQLRSELPSGLDLVVRPRRGAEPSFAKICQSLPRLARRLARQLENARP